MASVIADALASKWMGSLADIPCFASLHYEVPSGDQPMASEIDGSTYVRAPLTWNLLTPRTAVNTQALEWLNIEDTTIVAVGVFNAPFGGQLLLVAALDDPYPISGRGSYRVDEGSLYVTI